MSKFLKPSQLAKVLGVKNSSIAIAMKSRNGNPPKLISEIVGNKKMIDINSDLNADYIRDYCESKGIIPNYSLLKEDEQRRLPSQNKTKVKNTQTKKRDVISEVVNNNAIEALNNDDEDDQISDKEIRNLVQKKKKLEIKKLEADTKKVNIVSKKEQLQLEKLAGNLLPVDETMHVLSFVVSNYTSSAKSHFTTFLSLIVKELGGSDEDYKDYMDRFDEGLVEFAINAIDELEEGIAGVVESYKEVRSRGERK